MTDTANSQLKPSNLYQQNDDDDNFIDNEGEEQINVEDGARGQGDYNFDLDMDQNRREDDIQTKMN